MNCEKRKARGESSLLAFDQCSFEARVIKCVEEALEDLAPGMRDGIFWRLIAYHDIKPSEIADHPRDFLMALSHIVGPRFKDFNYLLIRRMKEVFEFDFPDSGSFADAIERARMRSHAWLLP
jgi:hypothetical protein